MANVREDMYGFPKSDKKTNIATSQNCGLNAIANYNSGDYQQITNLLVPIQTTGNPVMITLRSGDTPATSLCYVNIDSPQYYNFGVFRVNNNTGEEKLITGEQLVMTGSPNKSNEPLPCTMPVIDFDVPPGSYTYSFRVLVGINNGISMRLSYYTMVATEMGS